jgi:hypothetical protein
MALCRETLFRRTSIRHLRLCVSSAFAIFSAFAGSAQVIPDTVSIYDRSFFEVNPYSGERFFSSTRPGTLCAVDSIGRVAFVIVQDSIPPNTLSRSIFDERSRLIERHVETTSALMQASTTTRYHRNGVLKEYGGTYNGPRLFRMHYAVYDSSGHCVSSLEQTQAKGNSSLGEHVTSFEYWPNGSVKVMEVKRESEKIEVFEYHENGEIAQYGLKSIVVDPASGEHQWVRSGEWIQYDERGTEVSRTGY